MQNPLRVNLCKRVEDYPYSICSIFKKKEGHSFDLSFPPFLRKAINLSSKEYIDWLNFGFSEEESESIRKGLQKAEFKYAKNDKSRKVISPRIVHPKHQEVEMKWDEFMPEEETGLTQVTLL